MLAILLVPVTVRGVIHGVQPRPNNPTPEERAIAIGAVKQRHPAALVTLVIGATWMVLIGSRTFGFIQLHLWQIVLGIGTSAGLGWIVVALVKRWLWQNDTN